MITWLERAKDSLFLIPAGIILVLGVLSRIAVALDGLSTDDNTFPWLVSTTVDSARSILSTVATATVTVAAIVFAMTAVVVQLATSQFSPRVTQGFLRDRYQQVTIGLTIGTFVYALFVLVAVRGGEETVQTTHDISVTIAVVLAVVSMIAIVSFIDRIMRSMRIDTIVRNLAEQTQSSFDALPERGVWATGAADPSPDGSSVSRMEVTRSGWVRAIDIDAMLDALPDGTTMRLDIRSGDYIAAGEVAATMWPEVDEETESALAREIDLGRTRTIESDPSYGIRQMIDIALRALSPALNDATTGADVVHHLTGPIRSALLRELPGRVAGNDRGSRIFTPRALTHSDYVHGAFREIRINATNQPHVLRALLETLASLVVLVEEAGHETRSGALRQEAEATLEVLDRSSMPERDKEYLHEFARSVGLEAR